MSKPTFESAMSQLSEIVSKLERSDVKLSEATQLFEQGLTLIKFCEQQLSQFEDTVATILKKDETDEHN